MAKIIMAKQNKRKSSQFPQGQKNSVNSQQQNQQQNQEKSANISPSNSTNNSTNNSSTTQTMIKPEQMSLTAHTHIQEYMKTHSKSEMDKEDLNAVLRLFQHLRLFGLLSAVGYVNQQNAQEGKVRERTVPVWGSLLGQMLNQQIDTNNQQQKREQKRELMTTVVEMANNNPAEYMQNWRRSMMLAEHWNFWARAYAKKDNGDKNNGDKNNGDKNV